MLKVCSFLPAVTQMLYDMGFQDQLLGVTFECPEQALSEKTIVVHCSLEGTNFSSKEIDRIFSESKHQSDELYFLDQGLFEEIAPDIVFTQDVCEVCQIDTERVARAAVRLKNPPQLVPISPQSLDDVFESARLIAKTLGKPEVASNYLRPLQERINTIGDIISNANQRSRNVMLVEWIDPIFNCGHWIPHQIELAGGVDLLSNPAGDSYRVDWAEIRRYDPEVLVIAPCGFTIDRTLEEMTILEQKPGWRDLKAVQNNEVYIADFELFTQSSASTLVDGIELLAGLFHPELSAIPVPLRQKFKRLDKLIST